MGLGEEENEVDSAGLPGPLLRMICICIYVYVYIYMYMIHQPPFRNAVPGRGEIFSPGGPRNGYLIAR